MGRNFTAVLMVLALAACTSGAPSPTRSSSAEAASSPSTAPGSEPSASASVSVEPDEHPATGLALVRFPDLDSPASQVFVVEADGGLRQVTGLSGGLPGASRPTWSPDRTQIAFNPPKVGADMNSYVGVVNADGTGERAIGEITSGNASMFSSGGNRRWSPDGTRILFEQLNVVDVGQPEPQLETIMSVVDVATGEVTELGVGNNAQWLPNGERISFNGLVEGPPQAFVEVLYVMSLDGGEPEVLAEETQAFWSPDGSAVLLVHDGTVSLAEPDGSEARELANGFNPVWSPDGSRFVLGYFGSDVDEQGFPVVALVDLEGQALWSGVRGSSPTWSPDGTRLAIELYGDPPTVQVLDVASGEVLWEIEGSQPAWAP